MYIIVSVIQERPCHPDATPHPVILSEAVGGVKDLLHWSALSPHRREGSGDAETRHVRMEDAIQGVLCSGCYRTSPERD